MCTLDSLTLCLKWGQSPCGWRSGHVYSPIWRVECDVDGRFSSIPTSWEYQCRLVIESPCSEYRDCGQGHISTIRNGYQLNQQWRITDSDGWKYLKTQDRENALPKILRRFESLVIAKPGCEIPDFKHAPWDDVVLVTPRNAVRTAWTERLCANTVLKRENSLYVFDAEDSVGNARVPLNMEQKFIVAVWKPMTGINRPNKTFKT